MLGQLKNIERYILPDLLREDGGSWNSMDITYHHPHVERVWRHHEDVRIYLHRIYPCDRSESLWHPHDWPSAMKVVSGVYEMGIGHRLPEYRMRDGILDLMGLRLVTGATFELSTGSYYEMTDYKAWHYVRPIGPRPALSLMITGTPWAKDKRVEFSKPKEQQPPLPDGVKKDLLRQFAWEVLK